MQLVLPSDIDEVINSIRTELQNLRGKQILLTGAGGFLGRYFVEIINELNRLDKQNPTYLVAIDNHITSDKLIVDQWLQISKNVEWIYGDASLGASLPNTFDYIIHLAGIASPRHYQANPFKTIDISVSTTRSLLEKARQDNSRFLFFSSSEIYGDPIASEIPTKESYKGNVSPRSDRACYDESKRLGETLCYLFEKNYDMTVNVVRPFNVYGPGMLPSDFRALPNMALAIKNREPIKIYGSGKQTRTFCYITDALVAFLKILIESNKSDVFNVGNPSPEINMKELAELVCEIVPESIGYNLIPHPIEYPSDEPQRRCPDISKINETLKFEPKIDLVSGLNRFFSWSKQNY
jgi:UDP-glucuronate decarboxylase